MPPLLRSFRDLNSPKPQEGLWDLGFTPINLVKLEKYLADYDKDDALFILDGFKNGFKLHYSGPRTPVFSKNLISARKNAAILNALLAENKHAGWLHGPFPTPPILNLRVNPIGLVPKRSGGWWLITNLSFPTGDSVNDFIAPEFRHVKYALFDEAVNIVQNVGKCAFMAKADIKSAFNICPC
jgi:hypothetical protein